ncbi:MAG: hypothetical protein PVH84_01895 [Candidatus Aminicenantes bacterium]|jgi:hypothetical protein
MKGLKHFVILFVGGACVFLLFSCQKDEPVQVDEAKAEISEGELDADVPALHDLHGVVYPLWHDAYPEKDYALIKELLPEADSLAQRLDAAELPGILRDKKPEWEKGKEDLKMSLQALHTAVDEDDLKAMLDHVEAFHSAFERLVRIIRPTVPELEAFHQEMYKLYHYYLPNYNLENIRLTVNAMQEKLLPLKAVQLPQRIAEKQEQFDAAVQELGSLLSDLAESVKTENKDLIEESVEKVHTAYQKTEAVFD